MLIAMLIFANSSFLQLIHDMLIFL